MSRAYVYDTRYAQADIVLRSSAPVGRSPPLTHAASIACFEHGPRHALRVASREMTTQDDDLAFSALRGTAELADFARGLDARRSFGEVDDAEAYALRVAARTSGARDQRHTARTHTHTQRSSPREI